MKEENLSIEDLQTKLLEANEKLKKQEVEMNDLKTKNVELTKYNEQLVQHNNKIFNKLAAQDNSKNEDENLDEDAAFEKDVYKILNLEEK